MLNFQYFLAGIGVALWVPWVWKKIRDFRGISQFPITKVGEGDEIAVLHREDMVKRMAITVYVIPQEDVRMVAMYERESGVLTLAGHCGETVTPIAKFQICRPDRGARLHEGAEMTIWGRVRGVLISVPASIERARRPGRPSPQLATVGSHDRHGHASPKDFLSNRHCPACPATTLRSF